MRLISAVSGVQSPAPPPSSNAGASVSVPRLSFYRGPTLGSIRPPRENKSKLNGRLPGDIGHYVMICRLDSPIAIRVGSLGQLGFLAGSYAYVGSAMVGLRQRLTRHLGPPTTNPRWHIDYFLAFGRPMGVLWASAQGGRECPLARLMARDLVVISGFGSTDCRCRGHFFYSQDLEKLLYEARRAFKTLGREPGYVEVSLA
jgi:Uri superfamily endonuclease